MPPLRFIHCADIHLGVETYGRIDPATGLNTRLIDFTARFDEIVNAAIERQVDLFIFSGDAYRSRDPTPTHQREFAMRIRRLADAGIPIFLLVGNHDLPAASGRANSLDIFETLGVPGVVVGRLLKLHRIETRSGPVQIAALPWLRRSALMTTEDNRQLSAEDLRHAIQEHAAWFVTNVVTQIDPGIPAILAAHISVEGATYGSERSVLVGEDIVLPRSSLALPAFQYVALGHIHKHQILGDMPPLVYPGSIERVDFGEESDDKGYMYVEIDGDRVSMEFCPLAARRFVTIRSRPTGADPTSVVVHDIERATVADAVVRLIVESTAEIDAIINYQIVRKSLRDAFSIAAVRRDVGRVHRQSVIDAGIESLSIAEALDLYLRTKNVSEERRATLLLHAQGLIGSESP